MFGKNKGKNENKKQDTSIVTKESFCATSVVFSFLAMLTLCSKSLIFGTIGEAIYIFLTGLLGYFAYPIFLGVLYLSVMGLVGKRLVKNRKLGVCIALCLFSIGLLIQSAMTYSWGIEDYVKRCFQTGETFPDTVVFGAVGGLLIFGAARLISMLGAVILFSVMTAVTAYLIFALSKKKGAATQAATQETAKPIKTKKEKKQKAAKKKAPAKEIPLEESYPVPAMRQQPTVSLGTDTPDSMGYDDANAQEPTQEPACGSREFLFGGTSAENYQRNLIFDPNARVNRRPMENNSPSMPERESVYVPSYSNSYEGTMNTQQPTPPVVVMGNTDDDRDTSAYEQPRQPVTPPTPSYEPEPSYLDNTYEEPAVSDSSTDYGRDEGRNTYDYRETDDYETDDTVEESRTGTQSASESEEPYQRHRYMDLFSTSNPRVFGDGEAPDMEREERNREERGSDRGYEERNADSFGGREGRDGSRLLDDEEDNPYTLRTDYDERERYAKDAAETRGRGEEISERDIEDRGMETRGRGEIESPTPVEPPKTVEPPKPRVIKPYKRVPLDDFDCRDIEPSSNQEEVERTKENILATLEEFRITGATVASVTFGPTVTCYNLILPRNVAPRKVMALDESIAISLHSSGVNIYMNYEEGGITIEVPNKERQFVQLGCMLSGDSFVNAKPSSIMFAMGKDVANRKVYGDISKMIHMLVAGSSGSGKSVFLGSLIISLIYKYSPEELRLILIDPKKTEFVLYNNLPHLMINEIITDAGKAVQSLNWAIGEMNRRYTLFEQMSRAGTYVVNLDQYNEQMEKTQRLPKIVIIIDELADLMLAAKKEMEDRIQNLTQKARAAGIHLIVATQRPSTDVITGVIKSNLATRIAFGVATDVDSRVILDQSGAQKLLGKGDFLYTMPGINLPVRVQSAFISPEDSQRVVNFIKNNNEAYYDEEATAYINSRGGNGGSPSDPFDSANSGDNVDPVYIEALRYVILSNSASISMIQRKCSAGYNRAGKIIEWMEDMGYISPFEGAKARKVLITKEEFESKYGPLEK